MLCDHDYLYKTLDLFMILEEYALLLLVLSVCHFDVDA